MWKSVAFLLMSVLEIGCEATRQTQKDEHSCRCRASALVLVSQTQKQEGALTSSLTSKMCPSPLFQLSQAAASIDNRVPTPGSVAELNSQQALPDTSATDVKPEVKDEADDSNYGKKPAGVKQEVLKIDALFLPLCPDKCTKYPVLS